MYKYQGKERDLETGYDYFEARLYDSAIGRFMQVDKYAEIFAELSPYTGMADNPLRIIDPSGLIFTDVNLKVKRTKETTNSTIGILTVTNDNNSNTLTGYTLEKPNKGNQKLISRILPGSYKATRWLSPKFGPVIRLEDKNGRSAILFHVGNKPDNTQGCILVGSTNPGSDLIGGSVAKMNELMNYIDNIIDMDLKMGESTTINVEIENPDQPTITPLPPPKLPPPPPAPEPPKPEPEPTIV